MKLRQVLIAIAMGTSAVVATQVTGNATVWAQSATTGAIQGIVKDEATGEALPGVTVMVMSPALKSPQTAITDDTGTYRIPELPPGTYLVTFFYADLAIERPGVVVAANRSTAVFQKLNRSGKGEVIVIHDLPPVIDPTSTTQGITIDQNYTRNIPVPGRTFQSVLGSAAGSQQDSDVAHHTEGYTRTDDTPFTRVSTQPLSTFSIDVDTASYANSRRFLRENALPPKDAVRIEELINYFHYSYPAPAAGEPFSITSEVGPSPWSSAFKLVRVGLQSQPIADADVPARNLVFLLDVSGSMSDENKLPLLVQAMNLLVDRLRPQDRIAVVVYASGTRVVLSSTPGARKIEIRAALASLGAGGSTNGAAGIQLAYKEARDHFIARGINRVILCTDGDFNVGRPARASCPA